MPPHILLSIALALTAGMFVAIQSPTNAMLARIIGSPLSAALVSFSVGTALLLVIAGPTLARTPAAAIRAVPWYGWLGGAYGAFFVAAASYVVPRLGVASTLTLTIASQLAVATLIDHLGLFGVERSPVTLMRVAGVALVFVGAVLVRR